MFDVKHSEVRLFVTPKGFRLDVCRPMEVLMIRFRITYQEINRSRTDKRETRIPKENQDRRSQKLDN